MQNGCLIFTNRFLAKCLKAFTAKGFSQLLKYVEIVKMLDNPAIGVQFAVSLTSKGLWRIMRQVKTDRSAVVTGFTVDPFCAMPAVGNRQLLAAATRWATIATKTTIINPDHIEKVFIPNVSFLMRMIRIVSYLNFKFLVASCLFHEEIESGSLTTELMEFFHRVTQSYTEFIAGVGGSCESHACGKNVTESVIFKTI